MNGKIILLIVILIAVASGTVGGYLYRENKKSLALAEVSRIDPVEEEIPPAVGDIDISLSPIDELVLPDLNMARADFDISGGINPDLPEILSTSSLSIAAPQAELKLEPVELNLPEINSGSAADTENPQNSAPAQGASGDSRQGSPPAANEPAAGACAQFSQVADCSSVPEENRALCELCR